MRTYQEGDNVENHRVRGHRMMLASFFILLSQQIQPRSKASLQKSASKCGKTLHNTNLPAECPAFLTELHQLTNKDYRYFKVSQARYTWDAYFGQTNKSIWGRGQRNDYSHRHWLKIHPNSRQTSATINNHCSQFFDIRYLLQNKKLQRALEAVCAGSNGL